MIQQEKYGGKNSLKGAFMYALIKLNILYKTSQNLQTMKPYLCLEIPIKKLLKATRL